MVKIVFFRKTYLLWTDYFIWLAVVRKNSTNGHFVEETGKTGFLEKLVLRGFYHKATFARTFSRKKLVSELNYKDANLHEVNPHQK